MHTIIDLILAGLCLIAGTLAAIHAPRTGKIDALVALLWGLAVVFTLLAILHLHLEDSRHGR